MTDDLTRASPPPNRVVRPASEAGSLARAMAEGYADALAAHNERVKLALGDAEMAALSAGEPTDALTVAPQQVSWLTLAELVQADPERFELAWQRIKGEARAELDSGHRAAGVLPPFSYPWEQAQFLAMRQAFIDQWQPRGGVEDVLIDTMAQAHTSYQMWLSRLMFEATVDVSPDARRAQRAGGWQPPRLDAAAAMEQAAAMADRFQRMFLRALRALRDLRRYTPAVIVQNAGQVNVGNQQVNVAENATPGQ